MKDLIESVKRRANRRSFLKNSLAAAGAATVGAGMLSGQAAALLQSAPKRKNGSLNKGDAAILRFLAAAEIIETDLWLQYNELGGVQDNEVKGGSGSERYTQALEALDDDMPQYIHDNTDDEFSHFEFINAYLLSRGAEAVHLGQFRTLPSSKATGAQQIGRLTNLMQLTVDTSFYTRYRASNKNPDLDTDLQFPQAIPSLNQGQFPAIPRTDDDLGPDDHIQAIANTAAFHFCFIEGGGTSLYPSLAQRVSDPEVLRILLSIGPTETAHFQIWHDILGDVPPLTDPTNPSLVFPDLNAPPLGGEEFTTSLIMPEPTVFLDRKFPRCSIIRPTETKGAAMASVTALINDGLFIGQSQGFFDFLTQLALEADAAEREL